MADDDRRVDLGDSAQPEAMSERQVSTHSAQPDATTGKREGEFSAQPDAMELLGKSLQPDAPRPGLDPDGVGVSAQPEAIPLTTQQASPPPPADED